MRTLDPPVALLLPFLLMGCSSSSIHPDRSLEAAPPQPDLRSSGEAPAADGPSRSDFRRSTEGGWLGKVTCSATPPAGATLAPALPIYKGTCPSLVAGENSLTSSGATRKFLLVLPANRTPAERFPVVFMWHWLKGSASSFLTKGDVQLSVDQQRFIAVIPEAKGDIKLFGVIEIPWPFTTLDSDARMQEEYAFFDDMLACVGQQFSLNKECVSSAGVSAGALFTMQLTAARSDRLASFISLSGGIRGGGGLINDFLRQWTPPAVHHLPGLVLWGGPTDHCITLDFQIASQALEQQLQKNQEFFVECIHNCGHAEPPIDPLPGESRYGALWDFAFRHPYWLAAGESPYLETGLNYQNLTWCGVGKGSAKPRTGSCPPPGCPF